MSDWKHVDAPLPFGSGYAKGGLLVVHEYDQECGARPDAFEIWHASLEDFTLSVVGSRALALEIREQLMRVIDWAALGTIDYSMVQASLKLFAANYSDQVRAKRSEWVEDLHALDALVRYGNDVPASI